MRQECRYCRAKTGLEQHSRRCPRFNACKHCGHDLDRRDKKVNREYHVWCTPSVDDGVVDGIRA